MLTRRDVLFTGLLTGASALALPLGAMAARPRRVLHIDSYHRGNEWNDRIADALLGRLEAARVETAILHMDTKRRDSEGEKRAAAAAALLRIERFDPGVVTMSDDNAVRYVLQPHYRDAELPFVFCGLNWDASVYGLPYSNTTGMVEVSPIPQILGLLRPHAAGPRIGFIAEDTPTKRKEKAHHERLFGITYERSWFVADFAGWVAAFREAQATVDMVMLLGVGALTDWDERTARRIAETETRIPSGTDFAWLMPYALTGVGKLPEEQGIWAADAALRILDGTDPADIPISYNTEGELLFNMRVADALGIAAVPPLATLVD